MIIERTLKRTSTCGCYNRVPANKRKGLVMLFHLKGPGNVKA